MHIVEATLRQTWQRLFGPEITATPDRETHW